MPEEAEPDALTHLDSPTSSWKRLRANNMQERANREIKRRSSAMQAFPSKKSLLLVVGTVMYDKTETWSASRYF